METEKEIPATCIGRWNIIRHPATGEWVKTREVMRGETGVRSTRPGASQRTDDIWVTLETGEELRFAGEDKVIRKVDRPT